jgi:sigma-B regulation protein RsbU (phosphoserine phosphatase)
MLSERIEPLSRDRLAHIVKSLADGVVIGDLDGRFFLVNPAAMTILGMSPAVGSQQLAVGGGGAEQTDVPLPEWPASCRFFRSDMVTPYLSQDLPLARSLRGETLNDVQVFVRGGTAPDGAWLSIDSTPLRNDDGAIEGSVMVFRDVTVKKREIEQIELLSNVVEQTADSVLVTDRDGRIEYVNPACEATTGYSRAELLGRTPAIFKSGVHGRDFYTDLWRTLVGGQVFRGIITDRKKSGELYLSQQTITPMKWHGEPMTHLVSVARDITGLRKAAEREHELLLARSVQQRLYPAAPPASPGFDIFGAAFVADVTGGDYFDFLALPGERLGIVIGDVSGHGFDSALLMAETRAVLRSTIQTKSDPGEILGIINRVLAADIEGNRFVTMLLACLHGPTGRFTYASAGHSGYVLDGSGAIKTELTATGLPLGLFADAAYETSGETTLEPGEMILLLTDGVTDSEAPDQTPFGVERILDVVRSCRGERSREVVARLYREARGFQSGAPQQDDMTIVVCTADASANVE